MPELAEGLLPFKEAAMNTWELAVAFVLFSRNFLKWHHLVSVTSFLIKGSSKRKIKKIRINNGRRHVSVNCTKSFHKLNVSILFPAFFNIATDV
jgi:hypothetical protein